MTRYIFKRILSGLFTIWVTTIAVTLLIHLVPGDPVQIMYAQSQSTTPEQLEQIRHQLGLDRPIYEQYIMYMGRILRGDFGTTIRGSQPVLELLLVRLPNTLVLALSSLAVTMVVGVTAGFFAAYKRGTWIDTGTHDRGNFRHLHSQLLAGFNVDVCIFDSFRLVASIGN